MSNYGNFRHAGYSKSSVVLFLLLLLAFFGFSIGIAKIIKNNNEEYKCGLNQERFQSSLRSFQRINSLHSGDFFDRERVFRHAGINPEKFTCPSGDDYIFEIQIPEYKKPVLRCKNPEHQPIHIK